MAKEADLKTEYFHLHHLHLQTLSLVNVYVWVEGRGVRVDLRGSALLVGKPGVYSRGDGTLVDRIGKIEVLGLRVVVEFFIDRLVAGVGRKTGDIKGGAWGGGVGHVGGSGADTAGAKSSEEGSTVVLLGDGHLGRGSGGRLGGLLRGRGSRAGEGWLDAREERAVESCDAGQVEDPTPDYLFVGGDM